MKRPNFYASDFSLELEVLEKLISQKINCEHCNETSSSIHRNQCYLPSYCYTLVQYCKTSTDTEALLWGLHHGLIERTEKRIFALRFNTEYPNLTKYILNGGIY